MQISSSKGRASPPDDELQEFQSKRINQTRALFEACTCAFASAPSNSGRQHMRKSKEPQNKKGAKAMMACTPIKNRILLLFRAGVVQQFYLYTFVIHRTDWPIVAMMQAVCHSQLINGGQMSSSEVDWKLNCCAISTWRYKPCRNWCLFIRQRSAAWTNFSC